MSQVEKFDQAASGRVAITPAVLALTSGGVIPGVTSVAAPVFTAGSLPLVVAIALPARVATEEVLAAVTAELRSTTVAMSAEVGHAAPRGA